MRILIISNSLPFPPHDGSRVILLNLLKNFTPTTEIDLVALIDDRHSTSDVEMVAQFCRTVTTVPAKSRNSVLNKVICNLSRNPYNVVWRYSRKMALCLENTLRGKSYDVLIFYGVSSSRYGVKIHSTPKIAYEIDAGSLYFRRNLSRETSLYKKLFYLSEYLKIGRYERRVYPNFDRCIVVSQADKAALLKSCPRAKIEVIQNGIDTDYFSPNHREEHPLLLFSGNMDYPPNIHAALWFYNNVFEKIAEEFPGIRFCLAGKNPDKKLAFLRKDLRIIVTGFVKDIRPWFDKASLYVCPIISGSGIKNKILEAMAMEKPIVATSLSLDGIPCSVPFVLRADNSDDFAELSITALKNRAFRTKLGKLGRKFVLQGHKWRFSAERLERICSEICH